MFSCRTTNLCKIATYARVPKGWRTSHIRPSRSFDSPQDESALARWLSSIPNEATSLEENSPDMSPGTRLWSKPGLDIANSRSLLFVTWDKRPPLVVRRRSDWMNKWTRGPILARLQHVHITFGPRRVWYWSSPVKRYESFYQLIEKNPRAFEKYIIRTIVCEWNQIVRMTHSRELISLKIFSRFQNLVIKIKG